MGGMFVPAEPFGSGLVVMPQSPQGWPSAGEASEARWPGMET